MMLKEIGLLPPFECLENEDAVEVAKKLKDSSQRHIYVTDKKGMPIGIISTTDINNKIVALGKDPNTVKAKEIMSKPIEVFTADADPIKVYKEMVLKKRLTGAVTEENKFIGIVTLNRLINHITQRA